MNNDIRKEYLRKYQNQWVKQRRQNWIDNNGPCRRCGSSDNLQVDHIDRKEKSHSVAKIWSLSEGNPKRIEELKKCQVLCDSCHKDKNLQETVTACSFHRRIKRKCNCYN